MLLKNPIEQTASKFPQYLAVLTASLCLIINGTNYAWTSPSVPKLLSNDSHVHITTEESSLIYLFQPIGSLIGNPIGSIIISQFGPKWLLLSTSIPYFISSLLIITAINPTMIMVSRIIAGIGEGFVYMGTSIYIGEIAEPRIRGALGGCIATAMFMGGFFINVLGAYFSVRTTAIIMAALPVVFASTFAWMPNSPYYLLAKNRRNEAVKALKRLRNMDNVDKELEIIEDAVEKQTKEAGTWLELITIKSNRKAVLIMLGLRLFQNLSGITVITFYTQTIFRSANIQMDPSTATIIFCGGEVIMVAISVSVLDSFGRKPMMMVSSLGTCVALIFIGTYFYFLENGYDVSNVQWIAVATLICYIIPYCIGFGPIPSLMLGELFAVNVKSKAICVSMIFFCVAGFSGTKIFQVLQENFGMYTAFYLYSCCCFVSFLFCYFCMPETKGKTLEEIQKWMRGEK